MSPLHPVISSDRRRDLLALLLLAALTLAFFWKLAFSNLIIARGDIFTYFTPYRDFAAQALREGRIPLWNPYLFMGAPFLANSQAGVFYPLNWPLVWLETARAINWTIVLHVFIAASGVYAFARSRLSLSISAAFFAAMSFGLGGYLGTQIEHVNQLQGLAWLGWIFLAYERVVDQDAGCRMQEAGNKRSVVLFVLRSALGIGPLSGLIGLQLLAGHTQTVFITLGGLGIYAAYPSIEKLFARHTLASCLVHLASRLWPIVLASLFAIALSAVQLLPTLELTRESARSGGLPTNLAVSFSLDPRLIGRALLPDYAGAMPEGGEFTAFFSVTALVLMTLALLCFKRSPAMVRALIIVAATGVFLALGGYNPIYYLLLKIPGFDLFRAPARWIVLLVFAGSLLAGVGLDALRESIKPRWFIAPMLVIAALIAATFISAGLTPAGASGPLGSPDASSLLLWFTAFALVSLYALRTTHPASRTTHHGSLLILTATLELFFATRALPYNSRATAPDALTDLRPAITALQVGAQRHTPPDRFLSLSKIQFDPGDTAELKSIYGDQLPEKAFYDLIVATKAKEVVAPNLSMFYRVPSVDGYDGGVLPLRNYITFQRLLLDPGLIQTDGRLREQLKAIPDARWLSLMNARFILTDKVGDQWYDGVLYDLQFTTRLGPGVSAATDQLPPFKGDALGIVYADAARTGVADARTLAQIEITFENGSTQTRPLVDQPLEVKDGLSATRVAWIEHRGVKAIRITGAGGVTVRGLALIDQASGAFQSFVLAPQGRFRVAYSGDVKIYENVDALSRAFCVSQTHVAASDDEAIAYLQRPEFDPASEVVVTGDQGSGIGDQVTDHPVTLSREACYLVSYESEHVLIETNASQESYLVLTDAYYPGWIATVDGQRVPIERADVLFRAVKVPAGAHRVEFRYEPQSFAIGAVISFGAWVMLLGLALINGVRSRRRVL